MRNGFRHLFTARTSRVRSSLGAPALIGLSALFAGCGDNGKTSQPPTVDASTAVMLEQDNNFSSTSSLTVSSIPVLPGQDAKVCWTNLKTDIQGHAVDPTKDINDVSFIQVESGSATEVGDLLNEGKLDPKTNIANDWEKQFPNGTGTNPACVNLSALVKVPETASSDPLDPKTAVATPDSTNPLTYLMVFSNGIQLGYGARTMAILQPDPSASGGTVNIDDMTAQLSYTATFGTMPLQVDASAAPRVDWSQVTQGGASWQTVGTNDVSRVLIGFYANMDAAALQAHFLNLEQPDGSVVGAPTKSWEVHVDSGQSVDLSLAKVRGGSEAFTGFTAPDGQTGSWIMGMFCDACQNPAPLIVTLVDPQTSTQ